MIFPALDGELTREPKSREEASVDFGRLIQKVPHSVLHPGSANDIATIVRWATEQEMHVAAQGRRHSVYGRSQVEDGVVVDMSGRTQIHHVSDDRITLNAGATWRDVLSSALRQGLSPPVLPEYLDLSVGGTIAAGGIGGTSWRHGTLSDAVLGLQVVTGDGRILTCSHDTNAELFDSVRAGLGQIGIIDRVALKLLPAPTAVRRYQLVYSDLDAMLADQRLLLEQERWDYLQGGIAPSRIGEWIYTIDGAKLFSGQVPVDAAMLTGLSDDRPAAKVSTHDYPSYADRFTPLEAQLRSSGHWFSPHPWLFTFISSKNLRSTLGTELARLQPDDLGESGRITVFPLRPSAVDSPLFRLPDDMIVYAFNLMRYAPSDSPETTAAMVADNRRVYERVRAASGTLNPVSAIPMSPEDWRDHLGPQWDRMSAAKLTHDPVHTLTPGYELFPSNSG